MPMSIDTQIQIMTESGFSHDRPVPQIVYDTDYMYVIAGNYTNPSLFKLDYNLNIVMQVNLATLSEYRPYNLHLSYIISDNLYLYIFIVDTTDTHSIYLYKHQKSNLQVISSNKIVPNSQFGSGETGGYYNMRFEFNQILYNDFIFLIYTEIDRGGVSTEDESQLGYLYVESVNKNSLSIITRFSVFNTKYAHSRLKYCTLQWQNDDIYILDGYNGNVYKLIWNRNNQNITDITNIGNIFSISQKNIRTSMQFITNNNLHSIIGYMPNTNTINIQFNILPITEIISNFDGNVITSYLPLSLSIPTENNYNIIIFAYIDNNNINQFGYIVYKFNLSTPNIIEIGSIPTPNNVPPRYLSKFAIISNNNLYFAYKESELFTTYMISLNLPQYIYVPQECLNLETVQQNDIIKVSTANQIQACLRQYGDSQQDISQYTRIAADILNTFIQKTNTLLNTNLDYVNNNTVIAAEKINELINILKNGG